VSTFRWDDVSLYSVTDVVTADAISALLQSLDGVGAGGTITDCNGCIGGNTMSFAKHFAQVHAIEKDEDRFSMLQHNVGVLGLNDKVTCHQGSCVDEALLSGIRQDIYFFDPPWGGPEYMRQPKVDLFLDELSIAQVCERVSTRCRYAAVKVPTNFDTQGFEAIVSGRLRIHTRHDGVDLRKMLLLVVDYGAPGDNAKPKAAGGAATAGEKASAEAPATADGAKAPGDNAASAAAPLAAAAAGGGKTA